MSQIIICITGGIGSGKSVVSRVLRLKGLPVYDCDYEAKRIMDSSSEIKQKLIEWFGCKMVECDRINRPLLAAEIFSNEESRQKLNQLVHKEVRDDFMRYCQVAESELVFIETAIPATAHIHKMCDRVLLVKSAEEDVVSNVMRRNGMSRREVMKIIEAQREEFNSLPTDRTTTLHNIYTTGHNSLLQAIDSFLYTLTQHKPC